MYQMDNVTQHVTVRIEPFNPVSLIGALFGWIWISGPHKFLIVGPLYSVMVVTPAKDIKVPSTFAMPRGFWKSTTSNLHLVNSLIDEIKIANTPKSLRYTAF